MWIQSEIVGFVDKFAMQVFVGNPDIVEVAECVRNAQIHCKKVSYFESELLYRVYCVIKGRRCIL